MVYMHGRELCHAGQRGNCPPLVAFTFNTALEFSAAPVFCSRAFQGQQPHRRNVLSAGRGRTP